MKHDRSSILLFVLVMLSGILAAVDFDPNKALDLQRDLIMRSDGTGASSTLRFTNIDLPVSSGSFGLITKDGELFLHDFRHPTGNTFPPDGHNTFGGYGAGNLTIGAAATAGVFGSYNTAFGYYCLRSMTYGYYNTAIGAGALASITSGGESTAVGTGALASATTSGSNTAVGSLCMRGNTTGGSNTALGSLALDRNQTGIWNNAFGVSALRYCVGEGNIGFGTFALFNTTTGRYNVGIGHQALAANTVGTDTVAIGQYAGYYFADGTANTNGSRNTYIGSNVRSRGPVRSENEVVIGYGAIGAGSDTVTIGNASVTMTVIQGTASCATAIPVSSGGTGQSTLQGLNFEYEIPIGIQENCSFTETWASQKFGEPGQASGAVRMLHQVGGGNYVLATFDPFVKGNILHSPDYGVTWASVATSAVSAYVWDFENVGSRTVLAAWTNKDITKSTDGGVTWNLVTTLATEANGIAYCGNGIVVAGSDGAIYRSTDYGDTWGLATSPRYDVSKPAYLGFGILVAGHFADGMIYRSTDYGVTWAVATTTPEAWVMRFAPAGGGVVVGVGTPQGTIYRSEDYGQTWAIASSTGTALRSVARCGENALFAGHQTIGRLLVSYDTGKNWGIATQTSQGDIYGIAWYPGRKCLFAAASTTVGLYGKVFQSDAVGW